MLPLTFRPTLPSAAFHLLGSRNASQTTSHGQARKLNEIFFSEPKVKSSRANEVAAEPALDYNIPCLYN